MLVSILTATHLDVRRLARVKIVVAACGTSGHKGSYAASFLQSKLQHPMLAATQRD